MIQTDRLTLRRPAARDMEAFLGYYASERSVHNGGPLDRGRAWRGFAAQLGGWEINGFGMFTVTRRDHDAAIGLIGCWRPADWPEREIGWTLYDGASEGKGLAFEAAEAVIDHAFTTLGWTTAVSYVSTANHRSRALAERLGARPDPTAARPPLPAGVTVDVYRHPAPQPAPQPRP